MAGGPCSSPAPVPLLPPDCAAASLGSPPAGQRRAGVHSSGRHPFQLTFTTRHVPDALSQKGHRWPKGCFCGSPSAPTAAAPPPSLGGPLSPLPARSTALMAPCSLDARL